MSLRLCWKPAFFTFQSKLYYVVSISRYQQSEESHLVTADRGLSSSSPQSDQSVRSKAPSAGFESTIAQDLISALNYEAMKQHRDQIYCYAGIHIGM
uniref:Uncharacterized protein n=1 Tax=Ditylenchus dipsaci TaxID=166011 RepID=A0A915E293_9BILA